MWQKNKARFYHSENVRGTVAVGGRETQTRKVTGRSSNVTFSTAKTLRAYVFTRNDCDWSVLCCHVGRLQQIKQVL